MQEFEFAGKVSDLADGGHQLIELEDRLVILFKRGAEYYCIDDICTHDGGTLSDGICEQFKIACPRHGAEFDIRTGEALTMPATEDTVAHEVKIDGDDILIRVNED